MTHNWIKAVTPKLLGDAFTETVTFTSGLNFVAGTNGTGKTKLLELLHSAKQDLARHGGKRSSWLELAEPEAALQIVPLSPIRSLRKDPIAPAHQRARAANAPRQTAARIRSKDLSDAEAVEMESFASLLALATETLVESTAVTKAQAADAVRQEYGSIVEALFGYELEFEWDFNERGPRAAVVKDGHSIPLEYLSTGETALLSLAGSLHYVRDETDTFLIDEPEIHLNWGLEERLFEFLRDFASRESVQLIVSSHSRLVFSESFSDLTQFLFWENGSISVSQLPPQSVRELLAGDISRAVEGLVSISAFYVVEDAMQEQVLKAIAAQLDLDLEISVAKGRSNVERIASAFEQAGAVGVRYLVDNDNRTPAATPSGLIVLEKYNIENYLLLPGVLAVLANSSPDEVVEEIRELISSSTVPELVLMKELLRRDASISETDLFELLDRVNVKTLLKRWRDRHGLKADQEFVREWMVSAATANLLDPLLVELGLGHDR